jgi:hypothetical protein
MAAAAVAVHPLHETHVLGVFGSFFHLFSN